MNNRSGMFCCLIFYAGRQGEAQMNIRTRMMYKAIFLWERKGYIWVNAKWITKEKHK